MRLSELFENQEDLKFQMAWANRINTIPVHLRGRTFALAKDQLARGESASDAISTGLDLAKAEYEQRQSNKINIPKPQKPQKTTTDKPERYSKRTGKRWGNQYYKDPASSDGIKGAIAKNTPQALLKKAAQKVDREVGDKMDIGKALTTLNKRKRS